MANRWIDGLARYGGDESAMLNGSSSQAWAQVDGGFSLSSANPRTGTHCLRMTTASTPRTARRVFGDALTEVFCGVALYAHQLPTDEHTVKIGEMRDQANVAQITIWLGTDGAIELRRGATSLGRTVPIIGAGAWQHIEWYAKADNAAGAFELRVDQVTRLNLTGIDTVQTANVEFSQWAIFADTTDIGRLYDFADFFVNDLTDDGSPCNDFLGDCKSGVLWPNADTAQADFALSTGVTGYALIDEAPPNDTDGLTAPGTTARSDFGVTNPPANLTEVLTARPFIRASKDDAGTCEMAPNLSSGGTEGVVSSQPVATTPSYYDSNVPFDPNTAAPWDLTSLSAALLVIERTA